MMMAQPAASMSTTGRADPGERLLLLARRGRYTPLENYSKLRHQPFAPGDVA